MKLYPVFRRTAGFSMIELMVVVGIMVVLAGLLIASLPGIQSRINRGKVETFIAELESGLSKYQIDHGSYPLNEPTGDRDKAGIEGAAVLYKHLSGDWDLNGEVDFAQNEKVYVPKIDYVSQREAREPRSMSIGGRYMVIDSYSNPIRYLAQVPNLGPNEKRETYNPTYDIWSITDADPDNEKEAAKYITNWQGQ
jgi:prepilin-type N-terminal cleavage/methylation domain-containing protein